MFRKRSKSADRHAKSNPISPIPFEENLTEKIYQTIQRPDKAPFSQIIDPVSKQIITLNQPLAKLSIDPANEEITKPQTIKPHRIIRQNEDSNEPLEIKTITSIMPSTSIGAINATSASPNIYDALQPSAPILSQLPDMKNQDTILVSSAVSTAIMTSTYTSSLYGARPKMSNLLLTEPPKSIVSSQNFPLPQFTQPPNISSEFNPFIPPYPAFSSSSQNGHHSFMAQQKLYPNLENFQTPVVSAFSQQHSLPQFQSSKFHPNSFVPTFQNPSFPAMTSHVVQPRVLSSSEGEDSLDSKQTKGKKKKSSSDEQRQPTYIPRPILATNVPQDIAQAQTTKYKHLITLIPSYDEMDKEDGFINYNTQIRYLRKQEFKQWPEDVFVRCLANKLKTQSRIAFIEKDQRRSADEWTVNEYMEFIRRLSSHVSIEILQQQLETISMSPDEVREGRFRQYMTRITQKARICYSQLDENLLNQKIMGVFMNTVQPEAVNRYVQLNTREDTRTIDECCYQAEKYFQTEKRAARRKTQHVNMMVKEEDTKESNEDELFVNALLGQFPNKNNFRYDSKRKGKDTGKPTCFYCKETGHVALGYNKSKGEKTIQCPSLIAILRENNPYGNNPYGRRRPENGPEWKPRGKFKPRDKGERKVTYEKCEKCSNFYPVGASCKCSKN